MAAGKNRQAGGAGVAAGRETNNRKLILLIAAVASLTVVLSVGLTWFLLSDGQSNDSAAAETETGAQKALYLELPPAFLVTYNHQSRQRYMQVSVTALTRDQQAVDVMTVHLPLIRHQLNLLFGEQDFEALLTDAGKQTLRQQSVELINRILEQESPGAAIEQVLFTNFVMQ